jgi:hypothetical protein
VAGRPVQAEFGQAELTVEVHYSTKVDLEGDFPALPGMSEAEELKMIDRFFSMVFAEDETTLRTWKSQAHR